MLRAKPKRKHVHVDPFHTTTLDKLTRENGPDLLDRHAVRQTGPMDRNGRLLPELDVRTPSGRGLVISRPIRRLSDDEVAERAHYYRLAAKYEAVKAAA